MSVPSLMFRPLLLPPVNLSCPVPPCQSPMPPGLRPIPQYLLSSDVYGLKFSQYSSFPV